MRTPRSSWAGAIYQIALQLPAPWLPAAPTCPRRVPARRSAVGGRRSACSTPAPNHAGLAGAAARRCPAATVAPRPASATARWAARLGPRRGCGRKPPPGQGRPRRPGPAPARRSAPPARSAAPGRSIARRTPANSPAPSRRWFGDRRPPTADRCQMRDPLQRRSAVGRRPSSPRR